MLQSTMRSVLKQLVHGSLVITAAHVHGGDFDHDVLDPVLLQCTLGTSQDVALAAFDVNLQEIDVPGRVRHGSRVRHAMYNICRGCQATYSVGSTTSSTAAG